jgi:hypothetical protein
MECRLWEIVTSVIACDKPGPKQTYSDSEVRLVVLWAAPHDRPVCWACRPEN